MKVVQFKVVEPSSGSDNHDYVHDELLDSGKTFAIGTFMSWCGHCVKLTHPQQPGEMSEWDKVVSRAKIPVVHVEQPAYERMVSTLSSKQCELSRILSKSVTSFPFVAMVRKNLENNRINVHVYNGQYPMTAKSILEFFEKA